MAPTTTLARDLSVKSFVGTRVCQKPSSAVVRGRTAALPAISCTSTLPDVQTATAGAKPKRVFNFSAGPAALPLNVLEKAQADLVSWNGRWA